MAGIIKRTGEHHTQNLPRANTQITATPQSSPPPPLEFTQILKKDLDDKRRAMFLVVKNNGKIGKHFIKISHFNGERQIVYNEIVYIYNELKILIRLLDKGDIVVNGHPSNKFGVRNNILTIYDHLKEYIRHFKTYNEDDFNMCFESIKNALNSLALILKVK